jgi:hypothetical protein
MYLFSICNSTLYKSHANCDRTAFIGLWDYFSIGAPFYFVMFLDYWAWEYMTILSGAISI